MRVLEKHCSVTFFYPFWWEVRPSASLASIPVCSRHRLPEMWKDSAWWQVMEQFSHWTYGKHVLPICETLLLCKFRKYIFVWLSWDSFELMKADECCFVFIWLLHFESLMHSFSNQIITDYCVWHWKWLNVFKAWQNCICALLGQEIRCKPLSAHYCSHKRICSPNCFNTLTA